METNKIGRELQVMLEDAIDRKLEYEDEFKNKSFSCSEVRRYYAEQIEKLSQSAFANYMDSVEKSTILSQQYGEENATKFDIMAWDACRMYDCFLNKIDFCIKKGHLIVGEAEPEINPIEDEDDEELPNIDDLYN